MHKKWKLLCLLSVLGIMTGCSLNKAADHTGTVDEAATEVVTEVSVIAEEGDFGPEEAVDQGREEIPEFSCRWNDEANRALAYVAANIGGSDRDKQNAIIDALEAAWDGSDSMRLIEWIEQNYELYYEPDDYDFVLVKMVVDRIWSEE